jgi:hypothetical protein
MAEALQLAFLYFVPRVFVFIALAAWLATFAGMVRSLVIVRDKD